MDLLAELMQLFYLVYMQFKTIFLYWIAGVVIGSVFSVFLSSRITSVVEKINDEKFRLSGALTASILGAASPLCMYGTVPLIASLGKKGTPQYLLASFMVSSILINPNLFIFSFALGLPIALLRLGISVLAGITAGLLIYWLYRGKQFFIFEGFEDKKSTCKSHDLETLGKDVHRGILKTAPYFFVGILLTALFERYMPKMFFISIFGANRELGVLLAASLGVPVYVCGGGTIPLLRSWLDTGMSPGAVIAFSMSGASTKLTNLSAVKIILGIRNFIVYIGFNLVYAILTGWLIDGLYGFFL